MKKLLRTLLTLACLASAAAVAQPVASLSAASLAFGGQSMATTSPPQTLTITNTGNATLTVSNVTVSNAQFARTNNCTSVAPAANCTIVVTFTPAVAAGALNSTVNVTGQLTITSNGTGSPQQVNLSGTAEKSLVTHYYRSILRRAPDAGGKTFWEGEATRVAGLGANVNEVWYSMSASFYFSAEYLAFNRNNTEFVTDLYNTFFNRPPDGAGLSFWTGQMSQGLPREVVLASFMFSAEFANFSTAIFGNVAVRAELDVVGDFFRGLLARLADSGGFNFWVGQFRTAQCAGASAVTAQADSISSQFVASTEYTSRNRSNSQFIGDLYNAFLRRGGDLGGVQFWIGQLNTMTRDQVRQQFVASTEFQQRVSAVINQGCVNPPADCNLASVLCVGPGREYTVIQNAVNVVTAGQLVAVFDGNYTGFRVSGRNGTSTNRITIRAEGSNVNITTAHSGGQGIEINNSSYVTIEGFKLNNMPDYGIRVGGATPTSPMQGVIIRNNTVTGSQVVNLYASNVANSLIEGNTTSGAKESHGIYLANGGSDNTVVRGNVSFNNFKNGLHLNGDLSIGGDGLHTGVTIEENLFYDNTDNAMDLDGMYDSTVRNNVIWGNGRHGVRVFQIDAAAGAGNLRIYNNTIIVTGSNNPIKLTEDTGGHTIFNNILLSGSGGSIVVGHPNVKSNHNVVMGSNFSINESSTNLSLAQWRALGADHDQSSVQQSAANLFVNAATDDYRLKAGALAANAGVASYNGVAAAVEDILGIARPQGTAHDMGAYESF